MLDIPVSEYIYIYIYIYNGPGDQGSIPGRVISKTQKMVLDDSLLNSALYESMVSGAIQGKE